MEYYPTTDIVVEQRFGFGPLLNQQDTTALDKQFTLNSFKHPSISALPHSGELLHTYWKLKQAQEAAETEHDIAEAREAAKAYARDAFRQQHEARVAQTLTTELGFQERLVQFWSNHFTVSIDNWAVFPVAATIENEICRDGWNGRFADMLLAVCQHPTMLIYLENISSMGPNSHLGRATKQGLNENLAREILELHTLGVDGGYEQTDVEALSKAITGWTVSYKPAPARFNFHERSHEPGPIRLLGKHYGQVGEEQGKAVLRDLAKHPSTAYHLATKLCLHFLGQAPQSLVDEMAQAYLKAGTHLLPMYRVLVNSSYTYEAEPCRYRTPKEWLMAMLRSVNLEITEEQTQKFLERLGQPPFLARSPAGWSEKDDDYNSPSALVQRIQIAGEVAAMAIKQAKEQGIPFEQLVNDVISTLYNTHLDQHTQVVIEQTTKESMHLSLIWLSPQFQYR